MVPCREVAMCQFSAGARATLPTHAPRAAAHQREPRALPDRAVAADRAVVLAHDAVGDRQAEAGAAADRLGREERIVDARELLRRDARAGVGDLGDRAIAVDARRHRQPAAAAASRRAR